CLLLSRAESSSFNQAAVLQLACSKLQLKRQLDRAWSANLIERVETAISATRPQTARQRLRRASEQRAGQVVDRIAEVWVVENVEELGAETKPYFLCDVKLSLQSDIRLRRCETSQHIATEITLLPGWCCTKGRAIENLAAGILSTMEFKRHSRAYVRAGREGCARGDESRANNVNGRGRSNQNETVQRPAAQRSMGNLVRAGRRQIVGYAGCERMA